MLALIRWSFLKMFPVPENVTELTKNLIILTISKLASAFPQKHQFPGHQSILLKGRSCLNHQVIALPIIFFIQ